MTKPYAPRGDSLAAQVINFFRANPVEELTIDDIASKFAAVRNNVHTLLGRAIEAGLLRREQIDLDYVYSAGPALQADRPAPAAADATPADADPEAETFNAAIWADGELSLHGVAPNDDGITVLSADQAAQVLRLLSGRMYA